MRTPIDRRTLHEPSVYSEEKEGKKRSTNHTQVTPRGG